MVGMSKAALARCRKLTIDDKSDDKQFLVEFDVVDPRTTDRNVYHGVARTPHDVRRIQMSLMRKFRIPKENIVSNYDPDKHRPKEEKPDRVESDEVHVV